MKNAELIMQGSTSVWINGQKRPVGYAVYYAGSYTVEATVQDIVHLGEVNLTEGGFTTITRDQARRVAQRLARNYYNQY